MTTVLLIEDDTSLRRALRLTLRGRDLEVLEAGTGAIGLTVAAEGRADLVLLDLGLPDIAGLEVLDRLRSFSSVPVIVLTDRDAGNEKVRALEHGADDYITKPFDSEELVARVRAVLRRAPSSAPAPANVRVDDLEIDLVRRRVLRGGEPVHLTRTELALLERLVTNPGKLLTQGYLLHEVWGQGYATEANYLRVYVGQLRKKLGDDAAHPRLILTEPGIGYRWIANEG